MKTIIWDFDGTLVKFASWRFALVDVLNELEPGHAITDEQVRPFLRDGFPWHRPDEPHHHLVTAESWWLAVGPLFARAFQGVGFDAGRAGELATHVRRHMITPRRFVLFDDTMLVLAALKEQGWRQIILSNHIPELPQIVDEIGLSPFFEACLSSAITGYEKPNSYAFKLALETAGLPDTVWMIGDNINSDVIGAQAAGIPAILVHTPPDGQVKYHARNLSDVLGIVEQSPSSTG